MNKRLAKEIVPPRTEPAIDVLARRRDPILLRYRWWSLDTRGSLSTVLPYENKYILYARCPRRK